jgi:hypothetical protein
MLLSWFFGLLCFMLLQVRERVICTEFASRYYRYGLFALPYDLYKLCRLVGCASRSCQVIANGISLSYRSRIALAWLSYAIISLSHGSHIAIVSLSHGSHIAIVSLSHGSRIAIISPLHRSCIPLASLLHRSHCSRIAITSL